MTPPTLDELMNLAESATPGPWKFDCGNSQIETSEWRILVADMVGNAGREADVRGMFGDSWKEEMGKGADEIAALLSKDNYSDFEFIAAASPDTVLKILRDYKRMREALEKIKYGGVDSGVSANTFERILVMCETSTECLAALEFVKGSV